MEFLFTFLEGIASFISPCVLPMLPIYISYFAGKEDSKTSRALLNSIGFVIGNTIIFILFAIIASYAGALALGIQKYIKILFGVVIIIRGLNYMGILKIKFLNKDYSIEIHPFKTKKIKEKTLFKNNLLPLRIVKQYQTETKEINEKYKKSQAIKKATEMAKQTIDLIFPGEQQPESDHGIQYEQAETGTNKDRHFRRAKGWFGYQLKVKEEASRLLITVRKDDRNKVAILLNNEKLAVHPTISEADKDGFITLSYVLPQKLNTGSCPIRFIPDGTEWTSAVYEVRLLK